MLGDIFSPESGIDLDLFVTDPNDSKFNIHTFNRK
jgi:hypothetical protein